MAPMWRSTECRSTRAASSRASCSCPWSPSATGTSSSLLRWRGAAAYLTTRPPVGGTAIEVPDTLRGLMALAAVQRSSFAGPVIAVTGSVGKTSTKDLAWAALAAGRPTWANERSFNNEQGLPTTLLNTPDLTEVLVLEMGMRGLGEIAELCSIARPTIGVITRVAEAHSDRVGGIEGVARAKAELIAALPHDGLAILNADDVRVRAMASQSAAPVLLYGGAPDADVRLDDLRLDDIARPSFLLHTPWGQCRVHLAASGRHMAHNGGRAGMRGGNRWRSARGRRGAGRGRPHRHAHGGAAHRGRCDRAQRLVQRQPHQRARRSMRWPTCRQLVASRCSV